MYTKIVYNIYMHFDLDKKRKENTFKFGFSTSTFQEDPIGTAFNFQEVGNNKYKISEKLTCKTNIFISLNFRL